MAAEDEGRTEEPSEYRLEKARKEGKPISKQHHRALLQTLEDYIKYVKNLAKIEPSRYLSFYHKKLY